ncbi:MAG: redox-sensing transcriptional repressor Rex [Oscillospiraceae bacterium]|jgi:redox-sensing transcriptional repressor|nr:redox-sensing transcriptional repressor Rex [Oscillospiraceae bacterium]
MRKLPVSLPAYRRIAQYLHYLNHLPDDSMQYISATIIANALGINDVVVRKDLSCVSGVGKPKVGYQTRDLISAITKFMGHHEMYNAVVVGAGRLGQALISYENLEKYGIRVIAAFDKNPKYVGTAFCNTAIYPDSDIACKCRSHGIQIGIITVPGREAQAVCDALVAGGVQAIWNFAPATLRIPEGIAVQNEDMAASVAILITQIETSRAQSA